MSALCLFLGLLLLCFARAQYSVTRTNPLSSLSSKLAMRLVTASQGQMLSLQCPLDTKVSFVMTSAPDHLLHLLDHDPVWGDGGGVTGLPDPQLPPPAALPLPVTVRMFTARVSQHSPSLLQLSAVTRLRPQS